MSLEFTVPPGVFGVDEAPTLGNLTFGIGQKTIRFHLTALREGVAHAGDRPTWNTRVIGAIGVGLDVTPLVRLAGRVHDREKEHSLARLAAGVAHDLNNVLSAVGLTAALLSRSEDPAVRAAALANLAECADQGGELAQRLMDVARSRPTRPEVLVVDEALNEVVPFLRALVAGTGHKLSVHLDAGTSRVSIGPTELRQILLNLVGNARDAAPDRGSITLRSASLMIPDPLALGVALSGGAFAAIEVEDEGPGIPRELWSRVFEPYFTTKTRLPDTADAASATYKHQGTGLGLSISRSLARQAGGDLRVEDGVTRGARFILLIPLLPDGGHEPSPKPDRTR